MSNDRPVTQVPSRSVPRRRPWRRFPAATRSLRSAVYLFCLTLLCSLMAAPAWAEQRLGKIDFANSGSASAQEPFRQGMAALHSFFYEEAIDLFRQAQRQDPDFAMAYWGEAVSYTRFLWNHEDPAAARAALARLASTAQGRASKAPTQREKDYLQTAEALYGNGEQIARYLAFSESMKWLSERYPDDEDAAAFYALTLQFIARRGPWERQQRMQSAAILEELFDRHPEHPGIAHYLLHAYDDPSLAPLGLRAARVYADIAPAASHALHMPSHIFVQMGRWDQAIDSNVDAFQASVKWAQRKGLSKAHLDWHSASWLTYTYLQAGRYDDAERVLKRLEDAIAEIGQQAASSNGHGAHELGPLQNFYEMIGRYLIETRRWGAAPAGGRRWADRSFEGANATMVVGIGMAAAELGDLQRARQVLAVLTRLRRREESRKNQELAARVAVMEKGVQALIALREGQADTALRLAQEAAAIERRMAPPSGPPHPAKPAQELYGEVLLKVGRYREAVAAFEYALVRTPGRSNSLLGAARAAAKLGDRRSATGFYRALLDNWKHADADVEGLAEAKAYVGG